MGPASSCRIIAASSRLGRRPCYKANSRACASVCTLQGRKQGTFASSFLQADQSESRAQSPRGGRDSAPITAVRQPHRRLCAQFENTLRWAPT